MRSQLAQSFQTCREVLSAPELSGRIELLRASAGLWANALVTLKEKETVQDVVAMARQKGVIIGVANGFAPLLQEGQGLIMITFAKPQDVLREGLERLKTSLL